MWFLGFLCLSAVMGIPVNQTEGPPASPSTPPPGDVTTEPPVPASTPGTNNVTSLPVGTAVSPVDQKWKGSAETEGELSDDMIVQEGDLLWDQEVEDRNAVMTLWANAIVYYTISPELAEREATIYAAMAMITESTCIRFQKRTTELNYIEFRSGKGCASFVGCRGGAQPLYFSKSCSVGNLCHEMVHALGLHHEHNRDDRDQFITVHWENIMSGKQKNFKKKAGDTLNLPYDLDSIMHYGEFFFSADGKPTLVSNSGGEMGQRSYLSHLDIQKLNKLYRC